MQPLNENVNENVRLYIFQFLTIITSRVQHSSQHENKIDPFYLLDTFLVLPWMID